MPRRGARCDCPGHWRDRRSRWVVLRRFEGGGQLKCLDCGWKWKSRCNYVAVLRDWEERTRAGLTDAEILQRLIDGNLRIDPVTAVVESNLRFGRWKTLRQIADRFDSGYRFVKINWRGKQKKIAVHRLQWMAATLELIPDGYDVHHKYSPPRPQLKPNALENLELMESAENQYLGSRSYWDDNTPF